MEKNIFLIRTPLQALNAVEAKERFCNNDNNYITIIYRNNIDKKLIENIIIRDEWSEVIYSKIKPHIKLLSLFIKKLQEHPQVNICFLGDYSTIINYFINRLKYNKLIILEDGTATIRRAKLIENRTFHKIKKTKYIEKNIIELYFEKLLKIDTRYYYDSTLFTIYNLKNRINIIKNNYSFLKDRMNILSTKNIIFFIGSDIKKNILVNQKIFDLYISKVINIYKSRNIEFYYILHRKEDIEYMNSLANRLDFKCIRFDNIIELELLNLKYIPLEISTFLSTAVTTLQKLYPSKYSFYPIEESHLNDKFKEPIKNLYIQFEKEKIKKNEL